MSLGRRNDLSDIALKGSLYLLAWAAVVLLLAPTLIVLIVSFTDSYSLRFPPQGFSTRWYVALFKAFTLHFAAWNSFLVATMTTVLCVVLGTAASLAISRSTRKAARWLDALFMSPLILPGLAFGLSALIFFSEMGIPVSMTTLPYVIRTTSSALMQLSPALLESAASLGASRAHALRRVTLPLIAPGIAAGAFIAFMSSFDNTAVSLFLRDARTDMLPIRMWQDLESKLDVTIAALSSVLVIITLVMMVLMEKLTGISRRIRG
jgi:putative spermidine/putrescine transport system permease protein